MIIMKLVIFSFVFFATFRASIADLPIRIGSCPVVTTISNFSQQYLNGTWYEQRRTFTPQQITAECIIQTIYPGPFGYNSAVKYSHRDTILGLNQTVDMLLKPVDASNGKFEMNFNIILNLQIPYWILGMKYPGQNGTQDRWFVAYSCVNLGLFSIESAVIYADVPVSPNLAPAIQILQNNNILATLIESDQKCFI